MSMNDTVGQWYAHCHHSGDWFEKLTEPEEVRVAWIKKAKPTHEIETRLRLFKPVNGKLPEAVEVALAEWEKAHAEWEKAHAERKKADAERKKADAEFWKAEDEWKKVLIAHADELDALHLATCGPDCPWTPDNRTIFPKEQS